MQSTNMSNQSSSEKFGISVALGTPFKEDGSIDIYAAARHAAWVLEQGANGITLFGTTGEGASLAMHERIDFLDEIIQSGISAEVITTTICTASLADAILQAHAFQKRGIRQFLVTPPFYFNDITDDALFAWYSDFAGAIKNTAPRIILYHIPQVTDVPLSASLVQRLKTTFGDVIYGVKDSSGVWQSTKDFLSIEGLAVLVGDERQLAKAAAQGASGAISGMANLFPKRMLNLVETGQADSQIDDLVNELLKTPVTAGVKALISELHQQPDWLRMRHPLQSTPASAVEKLAIHLKGFALKGLENSAK